METLFDRFHIPKPKDFKDYNLIGIDFGDGELSASYVDYNELKETMRVVTLKLDDAKTVTKNMNAFYISKSEASLIYDVNDTGEEQQTGGVRYYNYKKCPTDSAAGNSFVRDDGAKADKTYAEVMSACFGELVNILFEVNDEELDKQKPTIILVGRPSSPGWKNSEVEYAKLLCKGLKLPEGQKPVYIAIQAESTAALARELDPKLEKQRIQKGEVVVVLDSGSSTFDITVIASKGGVAGEDSVQFGGNQLDECLLKLLLTELKAKHPGKQMRTKHGHKLGLRNKKENYYGLKGRSGSTQVYNVILNNKEKFEFRVDEETMHKALTQMPVRSFRMAEGINGKAQRTPPKSYASWLEACRSIYTGFYEEMQPHFKTIGKDAAHPLVPDRIILSGGVSVMPEVQKVIEEVFGVKPTLTDKPNYSVSTGLGYVLGNEVKKKKLLDKLIKQLDAELPGAETLMEELGNAGEDIEWETFDKAMKEWSEDLVDKSIDDMAAIWDRVFDHAWDTRFQRGAEYWYQRQAVETKINKKLFDSFSELFPNYVQEFNYQLPSISFSGLSGLAATITLQCDFFTNLYLTDGESKVPKSKTVREQCYQHFLGIEQKIRKGGAITVTGVIPVVKGIFRKRTVYKKRSVNVSYPGVRSMYINEKAITLEVAKKTRADIMALFQKPLEDYVESITPYFNMTARQNIDSKE